MSLQFDKVMLASIELLCLTAESHSFTEAALAAGLTPAAVSRSISRLEARLGIQLFSRTTRQVRLTDAGSRYVAHCRQALEQLANAEREATGVQQVPSGPIRISLPTPYGHCRVLPLLPEFRALYPGVTLEVQLSNRNVDLTGEGFDLAVRGRLPPDSGLVARRLEDAALVVVASKAYLERHPAPGTLSTLDEHDCIQFTLPSNGQAVPWLLRQDGRDVEVATRGGIRVSDDVLGAVTLARHGAGLLQTYRFIVEQDLAQGVLHEVLQAFAGASRPFSLLYPANTHMPRRTRVLIDFLVARLSGSAEGGRRTA